MNTCKYRSDFGICYKLLLWSWEVSTESSSLLLAGVKTPIIACLNLLWLRLLIDSTRCITGLIININFLSVGWMHLEQTVQLARWLFGWKWIHGDQAWREKLFHWNIGKNCLSNEELYRLRQTTIKKSFLSYQPLELMWVTK